MSDLFEVPYSAAAFPSTVARRSILRFHERDLAHALFVTGRAPGDRWRHGGASVWEWLHRTSLIPAYIRKTPMNNLVKTDLAQSLDRSEKVALSYALGQAMTGVFCQEVLSVRHLMHLDRYQRRWSVAFGAGRRRPDLFGLTGSGDWVVAEAKGRSNGMERSLPADLATQKGMIRSIAGSPPSISLGCVTSFPRNRGVSGRMRVDAVDPPPSKEAVALDVSSPRMFAAYYEPFVNAIRQGVRVTDGETRLVVSAFPGHGLRIGLRQDLFEYFDDRERSDESRLLDLVGRLDGEDRAAGERPDGTYVETEWSAMLSQRDYETEFEG